MAYSRYYEPDIETMPRAELEDMQAKRLLEIVPYVYERAPLYRETWDAAGVHPRDIKSVEDFRKKIPFINKDSIRAYRDKHNDPFGGLLCVPPDELTQATTSSGTSGDATFFLEQFHEYAPTPAGFVRGLWELGLRPGDYAISGGGTFRGRTDDQFNLLGAIPLVVDTWIGNWTEVIDMVQKYQPAYLFMVGPNVAELDKLSAKFNLKEIFSCIKSASFAGEPLGSRMRERITKEWGLNLFTWTSAGDTGTAWECAEHDGYHIWEDTVYVENLDPAGDQPVGDGNLGEMVCTAIDNRVAPLIRYRTDDLVRLTQKPCGCGRTHGKFSVLGRKGDDTFVKGRAVMPLDIWAAIEKIDATATALFQIIRPQRELDVLKIRVGYDATKAPDPKALEKQLSDAVEAVVGVRPELQLMTEAELIGKSSSFAKIPRVAKS